MLFQDEKEERCVSIAVFHAFTPSRKPSWLILLVNYAEQKEKRQQLRPAATYKIPYDTINLKYGIDATNWTDGTKKYYYNLQKDLIRVKVEVLTQAATGGKDRKESEEADLQEVKMNTERQEPKVIAYSRWFASRKKWKYPLVIEFIARECPFKLFGFKITLLYTERMSVHTAFVSCINEKFLNCLAENRDKTEETNHFKNFYVKTIRERLVFSSGLEFSFKRTMPGTNNDSTEEQVKCKDMNIIPYCLIEYWDLTALISSIVKFIDTSMKTKPSDVSKASSDPYQNTPPSYSASIRSKNP